MNKLTFLDSLGKVVTIEDICNLMEKEYEYKVYIGTDSQIHRDTKKVKYSTCIVLHKKNKGGRIFISSKKENVIVKLRERLMKEVWRSLETAFSFSEVLPKNAELIVHLDINKSKKYQSGKYCEELVGMVVGQGFKCLVKPDSWAASSVADRFV